MQRRNHAIKLLIVFSDSLIKQFHFLCSLRTRSEKTRCSCKLLFCFAENKKEHVTFIIIWAKLIKACMTLPIILKLCLCSVWKPSMLPSEWETALDLKLASDHLGNVAECYLQCCNCIFTFTFTFTYIILQHL